MGQQGSKSVGGAPFGVQDPSAPTMRAWVSSGPPTISRGPANKNASVSSSSASTENPSTLLGNLTIMDNVPIPEPTESQVRVKMFAASLNHADFERLIDPTLVFPAIMGTDGSGVVDKVGDETVASAHKISVGDRVYFRLETASSAGTLAEYCVVEIQTLAKLDTEEEMREGHGFATDLHDGAVHELAGAVGAGGETTSAGNASGSSSSANAGGCVPPSQVDAKKKGQSRDLISFNEAATMPSSAWTAFIALFDKLKVESGRVIFIDGAAGGVGSYAVQMCKMMGLFIIGTCSTYNVEYLKSLGVDVVIDYVMDDVPSKLKEWTQSRGVDYLLELVSPTQGEIYAKHIRFGGSLCLVGGSLARGSSSANPNSVGDLLFLNQISVHHVNLNGMHKDAVTWPLLSYLGNQVVGLISSKAITPCYHEVIPFEQAKEALIQYRSGHAKGKIVVRIIDPAAERKRKKAAEATTTSEEVVAAVTAKEGLVLGVEHNDAPHRTVKPPPPPPILKPESPQSPDEDSVRVTA